MKALYALFVITFIVVSARPEVKSKSDLSKIICQTGEYLTADNTCLPCRDCKDFFYVREECSSYKNTQCGWCGSQTVVKNLDFYQKCASWDKQLNEKFLKAMKSGGYFDEMYDEEDKLIVDEEGQAHIVEEVDLDELPVEELEENMNKLPPWSKVLQYKDLMSVVKNNKILEIFTDKKRLEESEEDSEEELPPLADGDTEAIYDDYNESSESSTEEKEEQPTRRRTVIVIDGEEYVNPKFIDESDINDDQLLKRYEQALKNDDDDEDDSSSSSSSESDEVVEAEVLGERLKTRIERVVPDDLLEEVQSKISADMIRSLNGGFEFEGQEVLFGPEAEIQKLKEENERLVQLNNQAYVFLLTFLILLSIYFCAHQVKRWRLRREYAEWVHQQQTNQDVQNLITYSGRHAAVHQKNKVYENPICDL